MKILLILLLLACGGGEVRLVKEDSLRNDTESVKKDIASFEKDIKTNPDKGFREDRFEMLKTQFLAYTEKCTTVEKEKDKIIQTLSNENMNLKNEIEQVKLESAQALTAEKERSAQYRTDAGKFWGIVYTLVGIIILLMLAAGLHLYLQFKNLGPSALMNSLSLAKKVI